MTTMDSYSNNMNHFTRASAMSGMAFMGRKPARQRRSSGNETNGCCSGYFHFLLTFFLLTVLLISAGFGWEIEPVSAAPDTGSSSSASDLGSSSAMVPDTGSSSGTTSSKNADSSISDARGDCVISLRFTIEDAPVAGASFTCIRAGNYSDFPEVRQGTAERVLQQIEKEGKSAGTRFRVTGVTDEKGELQFRGLPEGVYVIKGEDILTGQYTYRPQAFLMSARDPENEEPVTAQIKYERSGPDTEKPDPGKTPTNTPTAGKKLPQTGLQWTIISLMSGVGLLLILAGSALRRKPARRKTVPQPRFQ